MASVHCCCREQIVRCCTHAGAGRAARAGACDAILRGHAHAPRVTTEQHRAATCCARTHRARLCALPAATAAGGGPRAAGASCLWHLRQCKPAYSSGACSCLTACLLVLLGYCFFHCHPHRNAQDQIVLLSSCMARAEGGGAGGHDESAAGGMARASRRREGLGTQHDAARCRLPQGAPLPVLQESSCAFATVCRWQDQ
jgi:hypothetical protein